MKRITLAFLLLFVTLSARAGTPLAPSLKRLVRMGSSSSSEWKLPKLYDGETDEVKEVGSDQLLPNRVYAVLDAPTKQWFFALTNAYGRLAEPREYLSFGSILIGAYLGKKDALSRFRFQSNWKWEPTDRMERRVYWVQARPHHIRKEYFVKWTDTIPKGAH